ncbi:50S ribosomal protein L25/general stress protein Ctc [Ureibacillus manganicus]|uniref:Large ribosomal subunit protein bL25 n=1 Tax=Ureibacillus manganicus DSM 26584 TaxID=1384049 RepID=A0A0A3HVD3_9BACL|nr:50S ribosomal protein L25/general stress protein Ctc [Ureibacillus manganicus]KGR76571.1 50S ribosomal protein L25 [Ureibacillus manganicus DSM 26584]
MSVLLQATRRNKGPRAALSNLRNNGKLPGVVYGYNIDSIPIVLDYKETAKAVQTYGRTSVFQIEVEGKKVNAVITDVQRCALKGHVKHVDFLSINMSEELEVEIPVVATGESAGVKEGGILNQPVRTLKIKVKPAEMPEHIELDVSSLGIGDSISVRDININYEVLNADEDTLFTVTPPGVAKDDTAGQGDTDNADIKATEAPESEN